MLINASLVQSRMMRIPSPHVYTLVEEHALLVPDRVARYLTQI
jgi:hypothetical protein